MRNTTVYLYTDALGEHLSTELATCDVCLAEGWRGDFGDQGGIVADGGHMTCDDCGHHVDALSRETVANLRIEAGSNGDFGLVAVCARALEDWDWDDRAEIVRVLEKARADFCVGDKVEAGDTPDDQDTGTVRAVDGHQVTVAWDSLVTTTQCASLLRKVE